MLEAAVRCASCGAVLTDLDVVLDVGDATPFDPECWSCGSTDLELAVTYSHDPDTTYTTGAAYEKQLPGRSQTDDGDPGDGVSGGS